MALVSVYGVYHPAIYNLSLGPSFTSSLIDATGEKVAWVGRHWNPARATKNIRRVQFLFGTVTKAGGSGLTVSLQDIPTASGGNPIVPDETQDQTVAIANGDASFASNTWYRTGALSADRTVALGEELAVVVEYDGSGRLGADAVNINNLGNLGNQVGDGTAQCVLKSGAGPTWANVAAVPNLVLEYDDGTFGTIGNGGYPCSAITNRGVNTTTSPDEVALQFQVPFPCKVGGAWVQLGVAAVGRDFSILLSDAGGTIETVAIDTNQVSVVSGNTIRVNFTSEHTLSANTTYYLSIRPDTATSNTIYELSVNDANHLSVLPGGTAFSYASRTDAGAWTNTTTTRLLAGLIISALDDGTTTGGFPVTEGPFA